MRVETNQGVGLEVVERGRGPGLVLVHGLGGAKEDFDGHLDLLAAQGWRVIAFDMRGHGGSDHPPDPVAYSLDTFAGDIVDVADALSLDRFHLLGHSVGGMAARRVALDHSARVESLMLIDTTHGPMPGLDPALAEAAAWIALNQGMDELRRRMTERDPLGTPAHQRLMRERPGYEEFNERKWAALSTEMYAAMVVEIATQPDQLDQLRQIKCPTLVMVGEQDTLLLDDARRVADAIPGARLVVVADAGHAPQLETPDTFAREVQVFLSGITSP